MKKLLLILLLPLFLLSGCSDPEDPKTPAEKQIEDYTKQLEDCKEDTQKAAEGKSVEELQKEIKESPALKDQKQGGNESVDNTPAKLSLIGSRGKVNKEDFKIKDTDILFGDLDAKVVVIEYFSFTCPHCNAFVKRTYPKIKEKYIDTGKIVYVFREFVASKQDLYASILARCKGDIVSYKNFMLALLSQQDSWAFNRNFQELLTNIGLLGGVSAEEYSACIASDELNKLLMDNTQIPIKVRGFMGTPSFFINGNYFTKPYTFEELSKAIDKELVERMKDR